MADADPPTDDDQVAALKARVAFLEEQISRTLADKAALDARFRAEEADVRKQKAEAIAERDMWKTRCEASEQERRAGPGREVEALKAQLRDLAAEVRLNGLVCSCSWKVQVGRADGSMPCGLNRPSSRRPSCGRENATSTRVQPSSHTDTPRTSVSPRSNAVRPACL